ncbi:MAG: hypothetical protein KAS05_00710 [Candidatus Omnitrophica bacterium]|nr:hypothetical protein [Candidatus Omnitrophota bacterium]
MDVKLDSLIAKIKQDGIDEAKKISKDIIEKANKEAEVIVKEAKAEAKKIEEQAKDLAGKLKSNSQDSLKQASRDLVLTVKGELISLFDRILKDKTGEALSSEFMAGLITKIIDKWSPKNSAPWEILVNKSDKEKIEKAIIASLKKEAKATIEVRVSKTVNKGFRIGIKGEDFHYDFTDQSILEALGESLSPSLTAILDISNG